MPFCVRCGLKVREDQSRCSGCSSVQTPHLPESEWVYFATAGGASFADTKRIVEDTRLIIRTVYNSKEIPIANVLRIQEGDRILLVYGGEGKSYRPMIRSVVARSAIPVHHGTRTFPVFSYAGAAFSDRLKNIGYKPDPILNTFTGISIEAPEDLAHLPFQIAKPTGNNTLWRWANVFPTSP